MAATQENRLLQLTTTLGADYLLAQKLRAFEGISELFQIELDLLHEEIVDGSKPTTISPDRVIGQPMSLLVKQPDNNSRYFHGICTEFTQGTRNPRFTKYQAILRPQHWLLTQKKQSRIFQQKSVPEILRVIFKDFKVKYVLKEKYEPRNYCVQYRESDWDFAARLMEEEGIFFYFEHQEKSHTMIIGDGPNAHNALTPKSEVPFRADISSLQEWEGSILSWRTDNRIRSGMHTLWDHNFELVGKKLEAVQVSRFTISDNRKLEVYDYPGDYAKYYDGVDSGGGDNASSLQKVFETNKKKAQIRQQEKDVDYKNAFGTSDCCNLTPGYKFQFINFPASEQNGDYVIVALRTEAVQSPTYLSDELIDNPLTNHFLVLPFGRSDAAPFRPPRRTAKPVIHGCQTAVVVGPAGEEIFTDKYGRVKVQFHWDREGQNNASSSCWVRVAQSWAGKKWGGMFIPRIGMEVIVDFLEGDPDRPIITGCVYNAENMPPYELPKYKTRSTLKSNSTTGGGGFNEIRFEDSKGKEQIFIHAQKDMDIRIGNDCREFVNNKKHLIVESDQLEWVKKDKHLKVRGNQNEKIDGSVSLKVGVNKQSKIGAKYAVDAGSEIHMKAGATAVIEAGAMLTLKVGGNSVTINPAGVFLTGSIVGLNSGGGAGSGTGASPDSPQDPEEAAKDESGQPTKSPAPPPPEQPKEFQKLAEIVREKLQNPSAPSLQSVMTSTASTVGQVVETAANAAQNLIQQVENQVAEIQQQVDSLADQAMSAAQQAMAAGQSLVNQAQELAQQALDQAEQVLNELEEMANQAIEAAQQAVEQAQQMAQQALDQAQQAIDQVMDQAQAIADQIQDAAQQALDQAQQLANQAQEMAQQAMDQAQAAAEQLQQAVDQAQAAAQQAAEQVQAAVDQAMQQAQAAAEQAQQMAEQAQEMAQQAMDQAQQAVEQAQEAVQQAAEQAQQAVEEASQQAQEAVNQAQEAVTQASEQVSEAAQQVGEAAQQVGEAAQQISEDVGKALGSAQDGLPFM
jgi:type VI secretion system secreted protein VgrG